MSQLLMAVLYLAGAFCCMEAFSVLNRAASAMHQVYGVGWVIAAVVCLGSVAVCHTISAKVAKPAESEKEEPKNPGSINAVPAEKKDPQKVQFPCPNCGAECIDHKDDGWCHTCKCFFEGGGRHM